MAAFHPKLPSAFDPARPFSFPNAVMMVVGPHEPGSSEPVPESEKIGFVLDLSGSRMKLVGGGAPTHLQAATPDSPNVQRFDRVACS